MADVKKNALPNVGDYVDTPRFMTVDIAEVFDSYEDMIRAGYTEPTHFRGDFKVNGKSKDQYHMTFACSPNPDYRASARKSKSAPTSFSDMVKKQRTKNKCVSTSIGKSDIDWDGLVEKGQMIKQLLDDIKQTISDIPDTDKISSDESILRIIDELEDKNLIYNLNWNITGARTDHKRNIDW